ncbi:glycine betaine ABC transporter substrate-binding protein [Nocardia sp. BMG51109]|uniref:glycine betaine ABC transporter substrate-binding protein n=1 Tax=Nocardia sp. BMG51109 TaxID=1056816 RepID=UPI000465A834|nr:glycine betaine ABC transporter substrate-binding protein [Nocardia sp. BMG51109]
MELAASVRTAACAVVAAVTATLVVSCSADAPGPEITVGAGNSAQSELIAEIYAGALARAGARTVTEPRLGERADYLSALDADRVQLVGDQSGDLLAAFDSGSPARLPDKVTTEAAKKEPGEKAAASAGTPVSADEDLPDVADAVSRALPEGLAVSDIANGTDLRPALVFSRASAAPYPDSLPELAARCGELAVGIATGSELDPLRPSPDPHRDVLDPLRTVYGCDITRFTVYPSDTALREALRDGQVTAGVLTAPAALLPGGTGDLMPIADPGYAFRARNVMPLFRKGALTAQQIKKLNTVAGELTTDEFTVLIRRLRDDHTPAPELARGWLDDHDL